MPISSLSYYSFNRSIPILFVLLFGEGLPILTIERLRQLICCVKQLVFWISRSAQIRYTPIRYTPLCFV